jgi:hypothetical protein
MMILLKTARDCHKPKADNLVDIIGYADCVQMVRDAQERLIGNAAPSNGESA